MVGDSAATLRALLPMLTQKTDTAWRDEIASGVKDWWKVLEERAMSAADPINPQRVFWELSPRLPDNAIVTADSGSVANWYARDLKMRRGMKASLSGGLASLGAGTPYAMAAKMAYPDRTVIACMGDGAMQMNGINVMITISKYWKQWSNPAADRAGAEQPRPQPGDMGGAGAAWRRQDGVDAEHSRFPVPQICRAARAEGHLRERPGEDRCGVGRGAVGRPSGDPGGVHRPERATAAAAHHVEGRRCTS